MFCFSSCQEKQKEELIKPIDSQEKKEANIEVKVEVNPDKPILNTELVAEQWMNNALTPLSEEETMKVNRVLKENKLEINGWSNEIKEQTNK